MSKIKGVGNVKVLVTYSQTNRIIPMYNEDSSTSTTEEKDSGGGTRTVNENSSKKDIIYEEKNGVKTPITQSIINPTIEGAIITAQGATNADVKTNIVQAVEAVTGLGLGGIKYENDIKEKPSNNICYCNNANCSRIHELYGK